MKTFLGQIFLSYFPEGKIKNKIECFMANNYLFKNCNFKTTYESGHFIVDYNQNRYKFYKYPSSDIYEITEGYLKHYMIKKGDVVIDCGAYQGVLSILASQMVGENGKVIAFEPDPANYKMLLENLKQNNISNVITINKGLWSEETQIKFCMDDRGSSFMFSDDADSIITIQAVSLDSELNNLEVNEVNFIKADVEGAEIELINGSKSTLLNNKVNLAIASYHQVNGEKTNVTLEKMFKKMNYTTVTEFEDHLTTYASNTIDLLLGDQSL